MRERQRAESNRTEGNAKMRVVDNNFQHMLEGASGNGPPAVGQWGWRKLFARF